MAGDVTQRLTLAYSGRQEFKAEDAGDYKGEAEKAEGGVGFAEEEHANEGSAGGADTGPDGVACADGDRFKRVGKQEETGDHQDDGDHAGPEASKSLGVFEANGPCDFEQAGDD